MVGVPRTLLVCCLLLPLPALAARTTPADHPVALKLELGQQTAVVMPEPITKVIVAQDDKVLSVDYEGVYLFVLVKDSTYSGRLFVVLQSGKLQAVTFKIASPSDDIVSLVSTTTGKSAPPFSVGSMLRALRTQTALPGQQASEVPAPVPADTRVVLAATQAISVGGMIGMVVTVHNTQTVPVALDLRVGLASEPESSSVALSTWTWPPRLTLKAVAAEQELLPPDGQTRLYLVYQRRD